MGLDADTAETAALLGRACLALDRDAEAGELCSESERLAGHALKASIAWRTLRANLLSRDGEHDEARRVAEAAIALAERTDALVDHGDACLALATALGAAGDAAGSRAAAGQAIDLYERKGAAALAESARPLIRNPEVSAPTPSTQPGANLVNEREPAIAELDAAQTQSVGAQPQDVRLENAATHLYERFKTCYASRDWDALGAIIADDICTDDRRRVVNAGIRRGRKAVVAELSSFVDIGAEAISSEVIAIRGDRLILNRSDIVTRDQLLKSFDNTVIELIEIDADERVAGRVVFDADDFDGAFTELDARYLAGEAASHADTWSVITQAYAAINRREIPAVAPDWVDVDHRSLAAIGAGDLIAYIRAALDDLTPGATVAVEVVHRLSDQGVVVTHAAHGISYEGVDAEWRMIGIFTVAGDMLNRVEIFDETDLVAALARFEELHPRPRTLENAASRSARRYLAHYAARDWDSMAEALADAIVTDDRRRVVGAGLRRGRDAAIVDQRVIADLGSDDIVTTVVAIRGEHLSLLRTQYKGGELGQETVNEILSVVETDSEDRIAAHISFDPDDFVVAIAELESRYLAGDAAACARTWSAIIGAHTAFNRRELPPPNTDLIDHRPVVTVADKPAKNIRDMWEFTPDLKIHIESVHRLSERGGVVTQVSRGTSQAGFQAEWRDVELIAVEGDLVRRCEVFGEGDLDAAIAQFENLPPQKSRLENAASLVFERFCASLAARDWDTLAEMFTADISNEDRRRVVNAEIRAGRDSVIEDLQASVNVIGIAYTTAHVIGTRGERLVLIRAHLGSNDRPEEVEFDVLQLTEIDDDDRVAAVVTFDADDLDAAFQEIDARYLANEPPPSAHAYSVVGGAYAALNRREIPSTTPDWANGDHRKGATVAPGDLVEFVRAAWELEGELYNYIEAVHRIGRLGAVVTRVTIGTSRDEFDAEWRTIDLMTVDGDLVSRFEMYDVSDLDKALARFDELAEHKPALENAATRIWTQLAAAYNRRDLDDFMSLTTGGGSLYDRRKGLQSVSTGQAKRKNLEAILVLSPTSWRLSAELIAVRGSRLSLCHVRWDDVDAVDGPTSIELLAVTEVDNSGLLHEAVSFDLDNTEAAFAELEARYVAGEAAPHSGCWSAITAICSTLNGQELPETTAGWVSLDHRRAASTAPGDWTADLRAAWQQAPDIDFHISAVHRLSDVGAVVTGMADGTSREGFEAEWRLISLLMVDDDKLSRIEVFDEGDLDVALARFEELKSSAADK
jgi:hypothetical protein